MDASFGPEKKDDSQYGKLVEIKHNKKKKEEKKKKEDNFEVNNGPPIEDGQENMEGTGKVR